MLFKGEHMEAKAIVKIRVLKISRLNGVKLEVMGDDKKVMYLWPNDTLDITRTIHFNT